MFWKYNTTSSPQFEKVLSKENVTLQELMQEEDIIQECKSQNKKLVDFLCQRNILEELVTLITEEPSEELDERSRFKYPNIACELLTCDVPALNESLSRDNALLEKLYSFIDKDPPLNPLLASFLSRTLGVLIVKRLDQHWISYQFTCLQAMGFLKDKENFISLLLKHLGTSAIMDLTLKLITEVGDDEHRQNLLNWLDSQNLVQSLVGLFDPKVDSERQNNASQLICDVLRISREVLNDHRDRLYTDPILARLESPETVSLLLDHMLGKEKTESSIVGGIQILLALLGHKNSFNDNNLLYNNAYDEAEVERKQKVAQSTAHVIVDRLKDFHQILLDPPKKNVIKSSIGALDPPLGNTRLQVTKLLACLLGLDNAKVLREIIRLEMIEVLLDLFFKYVWNNFLHAQVQQCIFAALVAHVKTNATDSTTDNNSEHSDATAPSSDDANNEDDNNDNVAAADDNETGDNLMYPYLILKCRLLGRILEAWDDNEQKQTKPKGIRQGYMGHLINIANEVVQQCEQNTSLNQYIIDNLSKDTLEAWNNFVNGPLAETNKTQRVVLGGIHPRNLTGDDSSEDYNIPYPQAALLQQQMQQMIPDLNSSIFHDDEFNDQDDAQMRVNIDMMTENDLSRQAEMLKKVCTDLSSTLDDDSDEIIFDEERGFLRKHGFQSDEDNEGSAEVTMDVDPWPKIDGNNINTNIILGETSNPWASIDTKNSSQEDGWADFGSFTTDFSGEQFQTDPFALTSAPSITTNSPSHTSITSLQLENDQSSGDTKDNRENDDNNENNETSTPQTTETTTTTTTELQENEENVGDSSETTVKNDQLSKLPDSPPETNIEAVVISNTNTNTTTTTTTPSTKTIQLEETVTATSDCQETTNQIASENSDDQSTTVSEGGAGDTESV